MERKIQIHQLSCSTDTHLYWEGSYESETSPIYVRIHVFVNSRGVVVSLGISSIDCLEGVNCPSGNGLFIIM